MKKRKGIYEIIKSFLSLHLGIAITICIGVVFTIVVIFISPFPPLSTSPIESEPIFNLECAVSPRYMDAEISPSNLPLGIFRPNEIVYSNPKGGEIPPSNIITDDECLFTLKNNSNVPVNISLALGDFTFTKGDTPPNLIIKNSNTGLANSMTYGAYCWHSGMSYSKKVIIKDSESENFIFNLGIGKSIKCGYEIHWTSDNFSKVENYFMEEWGNTLAFELSEYSE